MLSICGILCSECQFFGKSCSGCQAVSGKPFWVEFMKVDACRLYDCCVKQKRLENCGQCAELPCSIYREQKDPNISEKEHLESIKTRVSRLKKST